MEPATRSLPRNAIGEFIGSPRGIRAFEALQGDTSRIYEAIDQAPFLTLQSDESLGSERVFSPDDADFVGADGGSGEPYQLKLAASGVTAGAFGDASNLVAVTFDAKGRATAAEAFELNSDNVTEGVTNLFFTNIRARAALSSGNGIAYDSSNGAIALDPVSPRNVDHSTVSINAGTGLTGGGSIEVSRTIALATVGAAGTYANPTSITVDAYGRVTAIS